MLTAAPLHTRERTGLVIASAALAVARNPLNRQVRVWLRDEVVHGVPFWLDHLLFMLIVVVWGAIGLLVLGPRGMSLRRPARPSEAWWAGVLSGLGLTALVMAAPATMGTLAFEPRPNWPVMFANFIGNFVDAPFKT